MTLYQIVGILKQIALTQPNVKSATDGSIYEVMDATNSVKYDVVHLSQTKHITDEETDTYGFNIFYVSRLEDSLEDNRLQIQSIGKEVLDNILRTFCENWGIDYPEIIFYPYTQKFADLCAGCYCRVELEVPKEIICADDFTAEVIPSDKNIRLQDVSITITENGTRVITPAAGFDGIGQITISTDVPGIGRLQDKEVEYDTNGEYTVRPDDDFDGLASAIVSVNVPSRYDEGYDDGEADQKAKLVTTTLTANDTYTRADGWSAVTVDVPSDYQDGYDDGVADQKAKMVATAITENGEYGRPDGYSAITVNVPQGQGYEEGYEDGEVAQKAKLTATSFTQNDTYTRADGWSSVTVNVDDRYDEGYSDGFAAGASACSGLFITAITLNVDSAITDAATATTTYAPLTSITDIYYTSSDPSIAAIDPETGVITAISDGSVTICTNDRWTGLQDCKQISVTKTPPAPVTIPYTADTSTVAATGETRCVTIDTTGLNTSTIGLLYTGATGLTYVINGNQICITFPENLELARSFEVKITASTLQEGSAYADITFQQSPVDYQNKWLKVTYYTSGGTIISNGKGSYDMITDGVALVKTSGTTWNWTGTTRRTLYFHLTGNTIKDEEFYMDHYTSPDLHKTTQNITMLSVVVPSGVTSIGSRAIAGQYVTLGSIDYPRYSGLTSIVLPNSVTSFGEGAFANNVVLNSIQLPSAGPTIIPKDAFGSAGVRLAPAGGPNVIIPSNVRTIKCDAFHTVHLNSITFPAGLVEMEDCNCCGVFQNAKILKITFNGTTPPTLGCGTLGLANTDYTICVPSSAVNTYKATWPNYADKITAITS